MSLNEWINVFETNARVTKPVATNRNQMRRCRFAVKKNVQIEACLLYRNKLRNMPMLKQCIIFQVPRVGIVVNIGRYR